MTTPERPKSGVVPFLTIRDRRAVEALEFYKAAFAGEEMERNVGQDGRLMQASLKINGGWLMLADDFSDMHGQPSEAPAGLMIHLPVEDADAVWTRAIGAGATSVMELADMFWGDRYGQVRDPFGHLWSVSTPLRR